MVGSMVSGEEIDMSRVDCSLVVEKRARED